MGIGQSVKQEVVAGVLVAVEVLVGVISGHSVEQVHTIKII